MNELLKIEKLDHFGRGIAKINNVPVFIRNSIPGDIVEVSITKEKRKYKEGTIKRLVETSKLRVNNPCKYNDQCGGCALLNMSYEASLKYKETRLKEILDKFGGSNFNINDIVYDNNFNYRNKIVLHIKDKQVGLYEHNSKNIIEISECLLVDNKINCIIRRLKEFIKIQDHNLEEIMIRVSEENILMDIKGQIDEQLLMTEFNDVSCMYLNNKLLTKNKNIIMSLCNYKFTVSPKSFFQINLKIAEKMFNYIGSIIKENNYKKVLDLYCGVGVIGIIISNFTEEVIGIETVEDAIKNAEANKKINNINNISFICGKVEDYINKFKNNDLIIVDPPRKGLDQKTIDNILRISPKSIIYVSCDAVTLARDIRLLSNNYQLKEVTPFDMFPRTYHVECISVLERRNVEK